VEENMNAIEVNRRLISILVCGLSVCASARSARAADLPGGPPPAATAVSSPAPEAPPPAAPAPPYSLPWQLRPVVASTVIRSDSSVALYDAGGSQGTTVATMLLGSYKVTPHLAPLVRLGFVNDDAPGTAPSGSSFINPIVGLTYASRVGSFRWAAFAGGTVPIGSGSGDQPSARTADANKAGLQARSGMDNAMFAVNYFTGIVGGDAAYVDRKLTVQVEATLFQLLRVHGDDAGKGSTDAARTNSTMGIHLGYFVIPALSLGAELRYQRWLTTPTQLSSSGVKVDIADASKDTTTMAIGPRAHFAIGKGMWLRPGISYARALDNPLSTSSYNMVQVDLPVIF
jgi:hypothetical protein